MLLPSCPSLLMSLCVGLAEEAARWHHAFSPIDVQRCAKADLLAVKFPIPDIYIVNGQFSVSGHLRCRCNCHRKGKEVICCTELSQF